MLGERSDQRVFGKRTGCTWTTWGRTPSTVCWLPCGAGCSRTPISRCSTALTTAGTACRPPAGHGAAVADPRSDARPRPGPTSTSAGRWLWGLRWRTALRQKHAPGVPGPADPARQGAGGIRVQPAPRPGVGLPEDQHEGGSGHDQHPGPGRGEGHLQSAGRPGSSS